MFNRQFYWNHSVTKKLNPKKKIWQCFGCTEISSNRGQFSEKKNLRIFLVSLLPCSCKTCSNCACWLHRSCQPFKCSPLLTDTLPKAQAALLLCPALSEGSRTGASFERLPGVFEHKDGPLPTTHPLAAAGLKAWISAHFGPLQEREHISLTIRNPYLSPPERGCCHGRPPKLH